MNDGIFNDNLFKKIFRFITNRLFIMFIFFCVLFYLLVARLFDLQIVKGEDYLNKLVFTSFRSVPIQAPRGTIYDRYGRPLAINLPAFAIKMDPSVQIDNLNEMLLNLVNLFESNGQSYVDEFPISVTEPYEFLFDDSKSREANWKRDMGVPTEYDAPETIKYLRKQFKIPTELSNSDARKILLMRSALHLQRYRQYNPITIAYEANEKTVIQLEEENRDFPSVYIDAESLRQYPYGGLFSHLIGYIRNIDVKELEANKDKGYTNSDLIGKTGIERSFESELKGKNGEMQVEIDNSGRRVRTLDIVEPVQGNKIFLTVDQRLQEGASQILEDTLTQILKNKLMGTAAKEEPITQKKFFSSMVNGNTISVKLIMDSPDGSYSANIRDYVLKSLPLANTATEEERKKVKDVVSTGIINGSISSTQMILTMYEQDIITLSEDYIDRVKKGRLSTLTIITEKLTSGEITPQMTNLDPCTGSVVVVDTKNGDVLAAVSYPTYDTNQLVNNFNNEYWYKINMSDLTRPMYNRAFMEPRAPGSTLKMLSALTTLEAGVINPSTIIYDHITFTEAGVPYAKCWSTYSHGSLNVSHALEVSCNYFFSEAAYRMGNSKNGKGKESIEKLQDMLISFGFNENTGVEIGEYIDTQPDDLPNVIAGPENKEYWSKIRYPDASPSQHIWLDGDTVRTAFGQSNNNYTAGSMVKYITALATGGDRLRLHFLDKIETQQGELVNKYEPVIEKHIELNPTSLKAVYDGMMMVTEGNNGTAKSVFSGFPVRVAGKTGTAQEINGRSDHSSFGGFAPYEDPQIAIYVLIPFGDTKAIGSAPAAQVAKKVIALYMGLELEPERIENNRLIE